MVSRNSIREYRRGDDYGKRSRQSRCRTRSEDAGLNGVVSLALAVLSQLHVGHTLAHSSCVTVRRTTDLSSATQFPRGEGGIGAGRIGAEGIGAEGIAARGGTAAAGIAARGAPDGETLGAGTAPPPVTGEGSFIIGEEVSGRGSAGGISAGSFDGLSLAFSHAASPMIEQHTTVRASALTCHSDRCRPANQRPPLVILRPSPDGRSCVVVAHPAARRTNRCTLLLRDVPPHHGLVFRNTLASWSGGQC